MVDYTKFKQLASELELEEEAEKPKINVTKFDKPTSVQILGKSDHKANPSINEQYSKWNKWSQEQEDEDEEPQEKKFIEDDFKKIAQVSTDPKQAAFFASSKASQPKYTENGKDNGMFLWSQTKDVVTLRVRCEEKTRAKDVSVNLNKESKLQVTVKGKLLLSGKLKYAVWDDDKVPFSTEEEKFQYSMTWELEDFEANSRCIVILLHKRPPTNGMRVWWKKVFDDYPNETEVDVNNISERSKQNMASFQKAWKEAHDAFILQRNKERQEGNEEDD